MKDIQYTKNYSLRRFLKEVKERKLYGKFLIALAFYYKDIRPQDSKNHFVRDYVKTIDELGAETIFHHMRGWKRSEKYNDIMI